MAPTLRTSTAVRSASSGATSLVVTLPSALVAGDAIVMEVGYSGPSTATISAPLGWTRLGTWNINSNSSRTTFHRIATATDPGSSFTLTYSGAGAWIMVALAAWSGTDPSRLTVNTTYATTSTSLASSQMFLNPTNASQLLVCGTWTTSGTGQGTTSGGNYTIIRTQSAGAGSSNTVAFIGQSPPTPASGSVITSYTPNSLNTNHHVWNFSDSSPSYGSTTAYFRSSVRGEFHKAGYATTKAVFKGSATGTNDGPNPTFVNSTAAQTFLSTALTLTVPSTVKHGDLIFVGVALHRAQSVATITISGVMWTRYFINDAAQGNSQYVLYGKTASPYDAGSTITLTQSGTVSPMAAFCVQYRHARNQWNLLAETNTGTLSNAVSVTSPTANYLGRFAFFGTIRSNGSNNGLGPTVTDPFSVIRRNASTSQSLTTTNVATWFADAPTLPSTTYSYSYLDAQAWFGLACSNLVRIVQRVGEAKVIGRATASRGTYRRNGNALTTAYARTTATNPGPNPRYRQALTAFTNTSTALSITVPNATVAGDLIIAHFVISRYASTGVTPPLGWTRISTGLGYTSPYPFTLDTFIRKASATDAGATYLFTHNGVSIAAFLAAVAAYYNVDIPAIVTAGQTGSGSALSAYSGTNAVYPNGIYVRALSYGQTTTGTAGQTVSTTGLLRYSVAAPATQEMGFTSLFVDSTPPTTGTNTTTFTPNTSGPVGMTSLQLPRARTAYGVIRGVFRSDMRGTGGNPPPQKSGTGTLTGYARTTATGYRARTGSGTITGYFRSQVVGDKKRTATGTGTLTGYARITALRGQFQEIRRASLTAYARTTALRGRFMETRNGRITGYGRLTAGPGTFQEGRYGEIVATSELEAYGTARISPIEDGPDPTYRTGSHGHGPVQANYVNVTLPDGIIHGDLIYAEISSTSTNANYVIQPPLGWFAAAPQVAYNSTRAVFYRIATPADSGTTHRFLYNLNINVWWGYAVAVYRDANPRGLAVYSSRTARATSIDVPTGEGASGIMLVGGQANHLNTTNSFTITSTTYTRRQEETYLKGFQSYRVIWIGDQAQTAGTATTRFNQTVLAAATSYTMPRHKVRTANAPTTFHGTATGEFHPGGYAEATGYFTGAATGYKGPPNPHIRGVSDNVGTGDGTVNVVIPPETMHGDLILVEVVARESATHEKIVPPPGWTEVYTDSGINYAVYRATRATYRRVAGPYDANSVHTFTRTTNGDQPTDLVAACAVFRAADPYQTTKVSMGRNSSSFTSTSFGKTSDHATDNTYRNVVIASANYASKGDTWTATPWKDLWILDVFAHQTNTTTPSLGSFIGEAVPDARTIQVIYNQRATTSGHIYELLAHDPRVGAVGYSVRFIGTATGVQGPANPFQGGAAHLIGYFRTTSRETTRRYGRGRVTALYDLWGGQGYYRPYRRGRATGYFTSNTTGVYEPYDPTLVRSGEITGYFHGDATGYTGPYVPAGTERFAEVTGYFHSDVRTDYTGPDHYGDVFGYASTTAEAEKPTKPHYGDIYGYAHLSSPYTPLDRFADTTAYFHGNATGTNSDQGRYARAKAYIYLFNTGSGGDPKHYARIRAEATLTAVNATPHHGQITGYASTTARVAKPSTAHVGIGQVRALARLTATVAAPAKTGRATTKAVARITAIGTGNRSARATITAFGHLYANYLPQYYEGFGGIRALARLTASGIDGRYYVPPSDPYYDLGDAEVLYSMHRYTQTGVVLARGQDILRAGTVLAKSSVDKKYYAYDPAGENGLDIAAGVLRRKADTRYADQEANMLISGTYRLHAISHPEALKLYGAIESIGRGTLRM